MSYLGTKHFLCEVQRGNVSGCSMVHKFGRNDAVPNGTYAFINLLGFTAWPLSAATTVRIKAGGNANDTAAGSGAREITVQGIDDSFSEVAEAITTAGAGASDATSTLFWRVHRAWVSAVGTYGAANVGDVTIENSAGGTDLIQIGADQGQTQFTGFTIPINKTGYLLSVHVTVDGVKPADVRCCVRENIDDTSAPMTSKRLKLYWHGIATQFRYCPRGPGLILPEKTDIWFEAKGTGAVTEVSCDFELLLVDN